MEINRIGRAGAEFKLHRHISLPASPFHDLIFALKYCLRESAALQSDFHLFGALSNETTNWQGEGKRILTAASSDMGCKKQTHDIIQSTTNYNFSFPRKVVIEVKLSADGTAFCSTKEKKRRMAITDRTFDLCVESLLAAARWWIEWNFFQCFVFRKNFELFAEADGMWMMDYSSRNWYNFWFLRVHFNSSFSFHQAQRFVTECVHSSELLMIWKLISFAVNDSRSCTRSTVRRLNFFGFWLKNWFDYFSKTRGFWRAWKAYIEVTASG